MDNVWNWLNNDEKQSNTGTILFKYCTLYCNYHYISADSDVIKQTLKLLKNTMFHNFHINL